MLSDFLFVAPHDEMSKLLVAEDVPVYLYVLNTTVTSIPLPEWRLYSHDTEYYFLTGAPFMDSGMLFLFIILFLFKPFKILLLLCYFFRVFPSYSSCG